MAQVLGKKSFDIHTANLVPGMCCCGGAAEEGLFSAFLALIPPEP